MKEYNCFKVLNEKNISHVLLNRPEKRNSMNLDFWHEFPEIISKIDQEGTAQVIVISSSGPHFCSGLDVSLFQSDLVKIVNDEEHKGVLLMDYIQILQDALGVMQECRIPVITAIQGGCIGGGLDLVCASDIRLGTDDCYFSILETKLGLVADVGTFPRLVKLIPDGLVRELAFTGRQFNGAEALASGFLNSTYPDQERMIKAAFALAEIIAANAPLTVHGCKEAINFARDHSTEEGLKWVKMWNSSMLNMNDIAEGFKASVTKKPGKFATLPQKIKKIG
ncbi:MAG: enoyl-CoA hydratase-related protein [Paracoccaceae bacterium]|nr:enoyl-CoA hydratase-related protein [Paracoccaceae bacterium]